MTMRYTAYVMLAVIGTCAASRAQPLIPQLLPDSLLNTPVDMDPITPGGCNQINAGPIHVVRVLLRKDALMTSSKQPCVKCIRSLKAMVGAGGTLSKYGPDNDQKAPSSVSTMDWPTPFDFDMKVGKDLVSGQQTAVQYVLLDSQLVFHVPFNNGHPSPTNASQAAFVDQRDASHFHCPTLSTIALTDGKKKFKNASVLQFFIDTTLLADRPPGIPATARTIVPPSVNIEVIWESPASNPTMFLPIAIDPHPTNNG